MDPYSIHHFVRVDVSNATLLCNPFSMRRLVVRQHYSTRCLWHSWPQKSTFHSPNDQRYGFTYTTTFGSNTTIRPSFQRRARTAVASVTVNSPALSSTMMVSMMSSLAIMTKRCAETHPPQKKNKQVGEREQEVCEPKPMYAVP